MQFISYSEQLKKQERKYLSSAGAVAGPDQESLEDKMNFHSLT